MPRTIAVIVTGAAIAVTGCTKMTTPPFHVDPITKPYLSSAPDNGYESDVIRKPFDLDTDCLPGLGGKMEEVADNNGNKSKALVCTTSAIDAISNLAGGQNTQPQLRDGVTPKVDNAPEAQTVYQSRIGRNRLQDYLFYLSNDICDIHKAAMFGKITTVNLGLDLVTLSTAAAATIVTGATASNILSGAAATSAGARASVNENLVQNQLVTAITNAIDGDREEFIKALTVKREKDLAGYTIEGAIADTMLYHEKCSLYSGLAVLNVAAEELKTTRTEHLDRAREYLDFVAQNSKREGSDAAVEAAKANAKIEVDAAISTQ